MPVYSQPEDLLTICDFETLAVVAGFPAAEDLDDVDLRAKLVATAELVAVTIETALAHRHGGPPNAPAPFLPRNTLSGSVTLTQWGLTAAGDDETDFADEIAAGEGIAAGAGTTDDPYVWAQVESIDIDETAGAALLYLESVWAGDDYEGAVTRGIVHPTINLISRYLVLDLLFESNSTARGKSRHVAAIGEQKKNLQAIKDGAISLEGISEIPPVRSSHVVDGEVVEFETDRLYGG